MKRRTVLSVGVGVALSGCLTGVNQPQTQIDWIRLVNNRSEAYTVDVIIEEDGEEIFTDECELGTTPESSRTTVETSLTQLGPYVLRFRADDQWVHIYPEEYADVSEECIGVHFELHRQGTRGFDIQPGTEC
jgi:hypothetical protein